MELHLTGRTILVTGASKGIGLGIAHCFAQEGCHLRLVARSGDLLARSRRNTHGLRCRRADPGA